MGETISKFLTCVDYTVSNKKFDLIYNEKYDMLETFPQPKGRELASYYESETYISHTDAKRSITDKIYQIVKKHTLQKKLHLLNSFKTEGKNLLDVGCGTGEFLVVCKNKGWNVVGVEPNKNARELALSKLNTENNTEIINDLFEVENQKFDVITLWHVLEHVPMLDEYIQKLKSLLKPNGRIVVAVPNFKSFDAYYYKQFWAAYDVPRHLWHFSKKAIDIIFKKEQLIVAEVKPMYFDSFYVSMLSEKYMYGKASLFKAFWVGLISNLKAVTTKEYSSIIYVIKNSN
ncbi:bifunctional 2-polyprenyl-6-hydroxyphenol methylase/3-demethylubiquinol 3-O-methyltransferase UbiG [Lutibacter sp.]|uniref:class I SAM-dependent methyltransferase n=1 Tax=Lutibacter sp. TaxID=1925666 RepID=UPI0027359625|nr:class I SAM-dependent methyltransferase [Lutibacter sp.]MDP3313899.1 class I SAM-dependent methyltransferase [Lutibacter sp.]